jgi:hypothetical protein
MKHEIIPIWLPAHSSNQLQPLDLCLFGILKRLISRLNKIESVNIQSDHIARVYCSFFSAATPMNIIKSFKNGGLNQKLHLAKPVCHIEPGLARCLREPFDG